MDKMDCGGTPAAGRLFEKLMTWTPCLVTIPRPPLILCRRKSYKELMEVVNLRLCCGFTILHNPSGDRTHGHLTGDRYNAHVYTQVSGLKLDGIQYFY